ncbi:MAG: 5-formyltetrahydrofolate cyclo-ligase [Pseudomonadota bacterium]|jgi:5-formyltetrahydrofolate cyclo-ligase
MVQQSKKDLRKEMKVVMSNLDPRWASKAHPEVCAQLTALVDSVTESRRNRQVLAWIPCFPGEVDLAQFIAAMLRESSVYLPRVTQNGVMEFVGIAEDWGANLAPGARGILQPRDGYGDRFEPQSGSEIFVITPGLAFDHRGERLGRGAGHYDRFLAAPELKGAIKIGVCWSIQLVPHVPTEHFDIKLDWICHERGALKVGEV